MSTFRSNHKNVMICTCTYFHNFVYCPLAFTDFSFFHCCVGGQSQSGQKIDMEINKATQTKTETVLYIQLPQNCNRDRSRPMAHKTTSERMHVSKQWRKKTRNRETEAERETVRREKDG